MIRLKHVTKFFGDLKVLDDIDIEINTGETFAIVGFSGSGKSVTLKHIIGLLTPDSGEVYVDNDLVSGAAGRDLERVRKRFGMLFQDAALFEWLTVGENIALPLRERTDMDDEAIEGRVRERLAMVNLQDVYDVHPPELSGGMRKRVGLARAIVMNPEVVLYDEPTSGLDPVTSRHIDALIARLGTELKVTGVVVTHDLFSALSIGARIAMIHRGRFMEVAAPADFIRSSNSVVKEFLEAQYITRRGEWEGTSDETKQTF